MSAGLNKKKMPLMPAGNFNILSAVPSYSLYLHIPFCSSFCTYCDFYSISYNETLIDTFIQSLITEFSYYENLYDLSAIPVSSIFIGGGTPTTLSPKAFKQLDAALFSKLNRGPGFEWTIECNPESFTNEHAECFLEMGVTRLTFGMQTLIPQEQKHIGRIYNESLIAILMHNPILQKFTSIGVDIIFGLPTQTLSTLEYTLDRLLSFPRINHLSAYELDLHPSTPLFDQKDRLPFPDEDTISNMYDLIVTKTSAQKLHRYEISNYALQGFESIHNNAYWNHLPYIGLGPSAHSFFNGNRYANYSDISLYINALKDLKSATEFREVLTPTMISDEMIFLNLRTTKGLNENDFFLKTGCVFYEGKRIKSLDRFITQRLVLHENEYFKLSDRGMKIADAIIRELV